MCSRATCLDIAPVVGAAVLMLGCGVAGRSDSGSSTSGIEMDGSSLASASVMDESGDASKLDIPPPPPLPPCVTDWGSCPAASETISLVANTPVGDFELTSAVFGAGFFCGCWPEVPVMHVLLSDDLGAGDPSAQHSLELYIDRVAAAGDPQSVRLWARRGTDSAHTDATLTLDRVPSFEELLEPADAETPAVVTGSLSVEAEGWTIEGTFVASYCSDVSLGFGGCE